MCRLLPHLHRPSAERPAAQRGQALIEVAVVAPIILGFVMAVWSLWMSFHLTQTYSQGSQTAAEWITRAGEYTPSMGDQIKPILDKSVGVDSTKTCLTIVVTDPDGVPWSATGVSVPAAANAESPCSGNNGWGTPLLNIPFGHMVQVDIWSFHQVGVFGAGTWMLPDGHVVMRVLKTPS